VASNPSDRLYIDDYDLEEFSAMAAGFDPGSFGYVVTPNVDQLISYHENAQFREVYADAAYVLFDSRFLSHWLALFRRQRLRVCPGSDLTLRLLQQIAGSEQRLVLVGGTALQVQQLSTRFELRGLTHIDPPMGFICNPVQVEDCLQRIEAVSPFRYCFLAVGSPQQELLAWELQKRGRTLGLALCVGASINFLTGTERRAPRWMSQVGVEWLFRLLQSPARLGHRYLIRGPRIFALLPRIRFIPRRQERPGATGRAWLGS
jgi:exopolysaccharide biosynthesis WecB/TagA/CpsF family protein